MATHPWEDLAPGYELRPAWRRDDPGIAADAIAFWRRLGNLPPEITPEERAREPVAVAYQNGLVVGVHTVTLGLLEMVRERMAMLRTAVDPAHRRSHVSMALTLYTRDLLERWALDHPEERLAGLGAIIEGANLFARAREPIWPNTRFDVAGYTPDGRQIRLSWFEHYRIGGPPDTEPFQIPDLAAGLSGISLREAWRRDDAGIEADVIDFWERLQLLPPGADPAARAKEILLAAYDGDRVIGVMTAEVGRADRVRARLAMTRGAVDPAYRRRQIGRVMHLMHRPIVEQWARDHPEERVAGLGGIVQSAALADQARAPYSPIHRYMLIGYTPDGHQFRVAWFDWARLDLT